MNQIAKKICNEDNESLLVPQITNSYHDSLIGVNNLNLEPREPGVIQPVNSLQAQALVSVLTTQGQQDCLNGGNLQRKLSQLEKRPKIESSSKNLFQQNEAAALYNPRASKTTANHAIR